jgi:ribosomal protein L30E
MLLKPYIAWELYTVCTCCVFVQILSLRYLFCLIGDLKSENILLDQHHNVVLIDFGTAKDLILTDLNGPEFVGTPDFMSVEAVSEEGPPAGPTADLWALGCLVFVMQTGHTPFWSPSPYLAFLKIKRARKSFNIRRPGGIIDDDCWDFICKLMQGDPKQRLGYTEAHKDINYDCLRNHPYLLGAEKISFIPTLWDLAVRACAEMAYIDSLNFEICDTHPPGDGSKHDLLSLGPRERAAVLHCLDRRRLLADYRLYSRFFSSPPDRVRQFDVVGLTQMNDDQGKPDQTHDPYSKHKVFIPIRIAQVFSPILQQPDHSALDDETRKRMTKQFKKCIAAVNRSRPHVVVVAGNISSNIRKLVAKVSDTIPVVVHDDTKDFTFWKSGVQCIAITSKGCDEDWLQQELEIATMSKHPLFVYTAVDPQTLGVSFIDSLAAGRTHGLFGVSERCSISTIEAKSDPENDKVDEDWKMKVYSRCDNGVSVVTVLEDPDQWTIAFEAVDTP